MQHSSIRSAAIKPEPFPISCVCRSLFSFKKCSTSEQIRQLGCVNFDLARDREEHHLFLHVSKRKDSDVGTKVSSAVVLVAGWLKDDRIKLSCYPMIDPDGILLLNGTDTTKDKVDKSAVPSKAKSLASHESSGTSVVQLQEKCHLWLTGSAVAKSSMLDSKKTGQRSRANNFHYSPVKRNGKRLLKSRRISRQHNAKCSSKCLEMPDINLSDSYTNVSEVQFDTNRKSNLPAVRDNVDELPCDVSVDEFLDFNDTEDEFEMHSCIEESDEPLFADFPIQEEKCCDMLKWDLQPTSSTLNSSGIAVIDRLDELPKVVVPSGSTTKNERQIIKSKNDPHEGDLGERYQISIISKLSDSQQNCQQASNDMKNRCKFSMQSESSKVVDSNSGISLTATSEDSRTSSDACPSFKMKDGMNTPYSLNKCEAHTDLSIKMCVFSAAGTSGSSWEKLKVETCEHPSVEIAHYSPLNNDISKAIGSKASDDPAANSLHGSNVWTAHSSTKHSVAQSHSENSLHSSMLGSFYAVGKNKSSSRTSIPAIPSKERDDSRKSSVVGSCSGKVSNSKSISSDTSLSLQGPFTAETKIAANSNFEKLATSSRQNFVSDVVAKCSKTIESDDTLENMAVSKSAEENSSQIPDEAAGTARSLENEMNETVCESNIESYESAEKMKFRCYDPLGPFNALMWNRRIRKVFRKSKVARVLVKPNKV